MTTPVVMTDEQHAIYMDEVRRYHAEMAEFSKRQMNAAEAAAAGVKRVPDLFEQIAVSAMAARLTHTPIATPQAAAEYSLKVAEEVISRLEARRLFEAEIKEEKRRETLAALSAR